MIKPGIAKATLGLSLVLVAAPAWADGSPFIGRWYLNRAASTPLPGEPASNEVTAEIFRADGTHLRWSLTIRAAGGAPTVETFDAPANGEFYPISGETTAAFRLTGGALQATFKGPNGQTDDLTCSLSADQKTMTCKGQLDTGDGHLAAYVDVYDRQ